MLERILFPTDGSTPAAAAMGHVALLAQKSGGDVVVVRALDAQAALLADYPRSGLSKAENERLQAEGRRDTDEIVAALAGMGVNARAHVTVGSAAEAILEAARDTDASLIAMATHGRAGLSRWTFGSVTEKVLRATATPTLVVRSFGPGAKSTPGYRHILVPVDGSELARLMVPIVAPVARLFASRVTVVHFVSDYAGAPAMSAGRERVELVRRAFTEAGIDAKADVRRGDAASGILDYGLLEAREPLAVDLVAMATHGRTGVPRWVFGSVTEKVVRHAEVPLLIARTWLK